MGNNNYWRDGKGIQYPSQIPSKGPKISMLPPFLQFAVEIWCLEQVPKRFPKWVIYMVINPMDFSKKNWNKSKFYRWLVPVAHLLVKQLSKSCINYWSHTTAPQIVNSHVSQGHLISTQKTKNQRHRFEKFFGFAARYHDLQVPSQRHHDLNSYQETKKSSLETEYGMVLRSKKVTTTKMDDWKTILIHDQITKSVLFVGIE